jgi:hypothetical protein
MPSGHLRGENAKEGPVTREKENRKRESACLLVFSHQEVWMSGILVLSMN